MQTFAAMVDSAAILADFDINANTKFDFTRT
jgi:hypothetical protein